MQYRSSSVWIAVLIIMLTPPHWTMAQESASQAAAITPNPVGLVLDARATAYTVDRVTGKVFCLPPGSDPVHYATVNGTPTALAVGHCRTLFVSMRDGRILAIRGDGSEYEACRCPHAVKGLAVDRDGNLLITTPKGRFFKIRRAELGGERPS